MDLDVEHYFPSLAHTLQTVFTFQLKHRKHAMTAHVFWEGDIHTQMCNWKKERIKWHP